MPVHLRELLSTAPGVREEGRLALLRTIMARPGSQADLSRRAGLSQATVSSAVAELSEKGYVRAAKDGRTTHISMGPTAGAAVGIELGFQHAAIVARRVEQQYGDAQVEVRPVGAAMGSGRWLQDVTDAVRDAVTELGEDEIAAIGLAVPRIVDPRTGIFRPPYLPPWAEGEDPAQMLAEELSRLKGAPRLMAPRVLLDNDANLSAYAESIYQYEGAEVLLSIKASTGIGAGIIIGGQVLRGAQGAAGEIGHVVVDRSGPFCPCGGRGCLEAVIGADALVEQARTVLGHRRQESPNSLEELVRMAHDGSLVCERVLREAATTLGLTVGSLCNVLNPQVIVLGGAYGRPDAARFTLEPFREAIRQTAMQATVAELTVASSGIAHPSAHGALVVALQGTEYPRK